jgi:hypothetical protein
MRCFCIEGFLWNTNLCVRDCSNDTNSDLIYDERNVEQCRCRNNFSWDKNKKKCVRSNGVGKNKLDKIYGIEKGKGDMKAKRSKEDPLSSGTGLFDCLLDPHAYSLVPPFFGCLCHHGYIWS